MYIKLKFNNIILGISLGQEIENLYASNPVSFISFTSSYEKVRNDKQILVRSVAFYLLPGSKTFSPSWQIWHWYILQLGKLCKIVLLFISSDKR